jgi:integrase
MSRPATGQVVERRGKRGRVFALRFRAYGERRYLTLGTAEEGWTPAKAEAERANILADVRRGIWQPPRPQPIIEEPRAEPTFHEFASEWLETKRVEGLGDRTYEDYKWALSYHLLPYFKDHLVSHITVRDVDAYKTAKAREGVLSANTTNKTITRLAQILELAVEYDHLPANPARGRRRRLKSTRPSRGFVQPEQLVVLLEAAAGDKPLLEGRGRPLLATLAGAGLRIGEALELDRRDVNLARGTLTIRRAKTDAGVRVVDLTPPSARNSPCGSTAAATRRRTTRRSPRSEVAATTARTSANGYSLPRSNGRT